MNRIIGIWNNLIRPYTSKIGWCNSATLHWTDVFYLLTYLLLAAQISEFIERAIIQVVVVPRCCRILSYSSASEHVAGQWGSPLHRKQDVRPQRHLATPGGVECDSSESNLMLYHFTVDLNCPIHNNNHGISYEIFAYLQDTILRHRTLGKCWDMCH
jgi:hypothetical protein